MDRRAYLPELDGLRSLAFFFVFGFHGGLPWVSELVTLLTLPLFLLLQPINTELSQSVASLGPSMSKALTSNGWVGVQLFFILSGYLITTLLLREEELFGRVDLRAFWIRRILRIWPLYYLTVVLTFLIIPVVTGTWRVAQSDLLVETHLAWFLGFLGNWSMIVNGSVGRDEISILWSVCVEEQFYILCPLLIVFVPPRFRLGVVVSLMACAIAFRAYLAGHNPEQLVIQYNTLAQLDTLLSGVALAIILHRRPPGLRAERAAKVWGWGLLVMIVWLLRRSNLAQLFPSRQTWDFVAVWICGLGVVAYPIVCNGWIRRALASTWLVWLGRISFGLYMYHEIALKMAGSLVGLGLTIAVSAASYYGFERPFLRFKRTWTRVPSRPV